MDWRLFISTFALIFVAELGDKTQLAALAASANSRSPWTIFVASATALVVAIGVAVLIGHLAQRALPLQGLRFVSGVMFIAFGTVSLYAALKPKAHVLAVTAPYEIKKLDVNSLGFLSRLTLRTALEFESIATEDYAKLALEASHPSVRSLFTWLSEEDGKHLSYIQDLQKKADPLPVGEILTDVVRPQPAHSPSTSDGDVEAFKRDIELLKQSARHEVTAMAFYRGLAESLKRRTKLANLFHQMALEENLHLERIHTVLKQLERGRV